MAPSPEVTRYVRNQSARGPGGIKLIVLHDTEGANLPGIRDLQTLGDWFDNSAAQASSHVANDAEGNDARYVRDERKAWHVAAYNSVSLGIEQIGFASQKTWGDAQLKNTAAWVAYWAAKYDIPLTHSIDHGVCMHSDLGTLGGGHHDPGGAYPFDKVLTYAQAIVVGTSASARKQKVWERHLAVWRSRLKSLLALRARMRQNKLERSPKYAKSTQSLAAARKRVEALKKLTGGKK